LAEHDWRKNAAPLYKDLFASGLKVLMYHGDLDLICNWMGGVSAAESFDWLGKEGFKNSQWKSCGYGLRKEFGNFSFIKVSMAGHMVPMDQPENAAKMLKWFIDKPNVEGQAADSR
jgi:serine carboxypeptidase-like clade 4